MENALAMKSSIVTSAYSTEVKAKSGWEELAVICSASARKRGLTKEDSRKILQRVRQMDEGNY